MTTQAPILDEAQSPAVRGGRFTGRKRRATRKTVRVVDRLAQFVITAGGIGVTIAFAAIMLFLVSVVVPLFRPPKVWKIATVPLPAAADVAAAATATTRAAAPVTRPAGDVQLPEGVTPETAAKAPGVPVAVQIDEYHATVWLLDDRGTLDTYRVPGGELVKSEELSPGVAVTAVSNERGEIALGRADGTVLVGRVKQTTQWLIDARPDVLESLQPGDNIAYEGGVAVMTPTGKSKLLTIEPELSDPMAVGESDGAGAAVRLVDYATITNGEAVLALRDDGKLFFGSIRKKSGLAGFGKAGAKKQFTNYELPLAPDPRGGKPVKVALGRNAETAYVVYADGRLVRFNTREPAAAKVAEALDLLPEAGVTVTSVRMLLGSLTLIVADSGGGVSGWFAAPFPENMSAATDDGLRMVKAHELDAQAGGAVSAIGTSPRDRQFVTGDAAGNVAIRHMTSGTTQYNFKLDEGRAVVALAMAPKNDAVAVLDSDRHVTLMGLDNPHADGSMSGMFGKIHYEDYAEPGWVWQSSSASQDSELKFSLVPLIFGTLKATLYAMLFAVPLAVMGAIYSSEFMQPQVRAVVKPVVEMMASLPSVVLGFIGALVLAPLVENVVPALLLMFAAVPLGVMGFGFVWQVMPPRVAAALPNWLRFVLMVVIVLASVGVAFALGPAIESWVFAGDFKAWLEGRVGSARPGWTILLAPLLAIVLSVTFNLYVKPHFSLFYSTNRLKSVAIDVGRFAVLAALAVGVAYGFGAAFAALGWDLREPKLAGGIDLSPIGRYDLRNSLLLGLIMGFAIIPIIYTVSEDALSSVPASLRSASLGAGATPWQTAVRVVLPVAVSGIFSACMIGLGRAVGETMIVLMMAGGTATTDMNIFEGLRALSANVATEMPEAPKAGTHYRVLFMSGLVLFAVTFVVNTVAEMVRVRFRKRAFQL